MQGDTFEFHNADPAKDATLNCVVECVPPTPGYYAGFVLQNSDPSVNPITVGPSRNASFQIPVAQVAANSGYTLNVTPAATAAGGAFTVKLSLVQGATALGGTVYSADPKANPPSGPMQLDGSGYVTAETGVVSGHQTDYSVSIVTV